MKGLQLQVSLHFGTRTGPYSVRFPAAVIETKMRHRQLNELALVRRADSLAIGVGAPEAAPHSVHPPPTCGRYCDGVPALYPCCTRLVPVSYLSRTSHVDRDPHGRYETGTRQVRDRCLGGTP